MFPYEIKVVDDDLNNELMGHFRGERVGYCQTGSTKWLLPSRFLNHADGYYNMPLREDDVWIVTYPRSGTTMCQEMIWQINNNFDYETASKVPLEERFPFYEFGILQNDEFHNEIIELNDNDPEVIETLGKWKEHGYVWGPKMTSPRHLKTHLPFSLLPPKLIETCKVIYVARNPKDVAVSYYHHNQLLRLHGYVGSFEKYWELFEKDLLVFSPFWEHIKEGWERRHEDNVLFMFYEDVIKDKKAAIKKLSEFLEKPATPEQIEKLADHLQIDNFKKNVMMILDSPMYKGIKNPSGQGFVRKGKIGGNEEFTPELLERSAKWIQANMKDVNFQFPV